MHYPQMTLDGMEPDHVNSSYYLHRSVRHPGFYDLRVCLSAPSGPLEAEWETYEGLTATEALDVIETQFRLLYPA